MARRTVALAKAAAVYHGILALDPDHVVALRQLAALAIEFGDARAVYKQTELRQVR